HDSYTLTLHDALPIWLVPTSSADALRYGTIPQLHRDCVTASWSVAGCVGSMRLYEHGGLASTGKAVDLKSTGPRGPWGFESLALRHSDQQVVNHTRGTAEQPNTANC